MKFDKNEIAAIRAALLAAPEPIECPEDCEHIECGYVVAMERHAADVTNLTVTVMPHLLDALETSRAQEAQTRAVLDGFAGELQQIKLERDALLNVGVPTETKCPKCNTLHVDQEQWATTPHRTHLCHACGNLWRPYAVATYGTDFHAACREQLSEQGVRYQTQVDNLNDRVIDLEVQNAHFKADNEALLTRRDELLALVAKMTRETPYPAELDECRSARAALVAEVGTLRARIAELESKS